MKKFNFASFLVRFAAAATLVLLTYNPTGYSYYNWLQQAMVDGGEGFGPKQAFAGVVILIGWAILVNSTLASLGGLGLILASAFIGTLVWLISSFGWFEIESAVAITWAALISLSALLALGLSWSHIRRRMSGQVDVDDIGE